MKNAVPGCTAWLLSVLLLATSCASTRQIETSSPRPRVFPGTAGGEAAGLAVLAIDIETGNTTLPEDVQALRFRIDEIRVHAEGGEWITFPGELNTFEILPDRYLGKAILSTRVQPLKYDSIAVKISDAFVLFGENAGGPVTLPKDEALEIAVEMEPTVDNGTQVVITIEPAASLYKDNNCRWFFVPFWTARIE